MMIGRRVLATCAVLLAATIAAGADEAKPAASNPYAQWKNGPPKDAGYFPIAVWLQAPANAARYKNAGINVYVGLWQGPTTAQLAELKKNGMQVICDQNAVGLAHKDDPTIIGWMHGDEPDNAQELPGGKGYGQPILPSKIFAEYEAVRKTDPTRPVLLNLGVGVAWDGWYGRNVPENLRETYAESQYVKGCDVVSFDIYPVASDDAAVKNKLDFVALGVERLVKWTDGRKVVWNCIECGRIGGTGKATPKQVKAEVWMSLVHGSQGIIYFVHQFKPTFNEHSLLDDPEMLVAVTALDKQIHELAPALNSPTVKDTLKVESSNKEVPVAAMVKKEGGATYVFAVAMKPGETETTFALEGLPAGAQIEVLGENRKIEPADGKFTDRFSNWDVHLYRVK
ncbi:MAG: hypothetical protein ABSA67_03765 [Candidatus Brocadiia bacterium]|jgi:hypothetical protein